MKLLLSLISVCGCKSFIISVVRFFVKPITSQPAYFLLLYVLLNVLDIYSVAILNSYTPFLKIASGFLFCYILVLPVVLMPIMFRKVYKVIILLVALSLFAIDIYLLLQYRETLYTISKEVVAAMLATNPAEAEDFFLTYFAVEELLVILFSISLLLLVFYYINRLVFKWNVVRKIVLFVFIMFSAIISINKINIIKSGNLYYLFTQQTVDLREYRHNPTVTYHGDRPNNIVLILGESFSKHHSSLYGYNKQTNPLLGEMREDSALFVFENIESVGVSTIPAVKSIMMSYTDTMADSIPWYKCLTVLEILQNSVYNTNWISNQVKVGLMNNDIGAFSDLCDKQVFLDKNVLGAEKETDGGFYDERLIKVVEDAISDKLAETFYVVHLMGSHYIYRSRYPKSFSKFVSDDYEKSYPHLTCDKRQVVAEYDNSILYSDSVVYEIMNRFKNEDAVVFYLSDHGQDIFDSSNDYAGHAKVNNPVSRKAGVEVPLMVYTTPLFREKHPQLQERIERSVSTPYRTDSIMYTIMDVAGVETVNGVSYKHKSLFR